VVFSHGLGAHHDSYAEIAGHWASHGYIVFQPRHADAWTAVAESHPDLEMDPTDRTLAWQKDALIESFLVSLVFNPAYWLSRVDEVHALLDVAPRLAADAGFEGDLETSGAGMSGHSYGAHTAVVVAGAFIDLPKWRRSQMRPSQVTAAIALSPPGPGEKGLTVKSYEGIEIPLMTIMGSHDFASRGQGVDWRRKAYDLAVRSPNRHVAIINDIDHALGGLAMVGRGHFRDDEESRSLVLGQTLAFWRGTLDADAEASAWLAGPSPHPRLLREHAP
jgi:dienelactone hydrolase